MAWGWERDGRPEAHRLEVRGRFGCGDPGWRLAGRRRVEGSRGRVEARGGDYSTERIVAAPLRLLGSSRTTLWTGGSVCVALAAYFDTQQQSAMNNGNNEVFALQFVLTRVHLSEHSRSPKS